MSIDKSGKSSAGSSSEDLKEYLEAYSVDGYKVSDFRQAKCNCGGDTFQLLADDEEGGAQRTCTSCALSQFICDSEEYWDGASPEQWKCIDCGSTSANLGVGFSLYENGEVRWLYIGTRCSGCGILGCPAGWKVGYSPSKQLLDQT